MLGLYGCHTGTTEAKEIYDLSSWHRAMHLPHRQFRSPDATHSKNFMGVRPLFFSPHRWLLL
jgi:hypothetical protein